MEEFEGMEEKVSLDSMKKELSELENILDVYNNAVKANAGIGTIVDEKPAQDSLDDRYLAEIRDMKRKIDEMEKKLAVIDELNARLDILEEMDEKIDYVKRFMDTKLNIDFQAMYNNLLEQMNVESIKTYRNIQAVIVEEDSKQNHVLFGVDGKSDKLKFRLNHVMIISIVSFIVSIVVMIVQILPRFGINLF